MARLQNQWGADSIDFWFSLALIFKFILKAPPPDLPLEKRGGAYSPKINGVRLEWHLLKP